MTKYDEATIERAFALYSNGMPLERIPKEVKVSKQTLYDWRKRFKWKDRKKKIELRALEKSDETLAEIKDRQHKLLKAIMSRYAEDLRDKKIHPNTQDMITVLRHEMQLFGELKPEINISVNTFFDDIKEALKSVQQRASAIDIKPERVSEGPVPERK